jgi:hypothetical protein
LTVQTLEPIKIVRKHTFPNAALLSRRKRCIIVTRRTLSGYQAGQYENASYFKKLHYQLGIPATALAAIAGTTVFANLGKDFSTGSYRDADVSELWETRGVTPVNLTSIW